MESELEKQIREHPIVMFNRAIAALGLRKREADAVLDECEGDYRTAVEYLIEKYGDTSLSGFGDPSDQALAVRPAGARPIE